MNKIDFQKSLWIDVFERLPPFRDVIDVCLFVPKLGFMFIVEANRAWDAGVLIRKGQTERLPWELQYSHWMTLNPPEGFDSRLQLLCKENSERAVYYEKKLIKERHEPK